MNILLFVIFAHVFLLLYCLFIRHYHYLEPPVIMLIAWTCSLLFYLLNYNSYEQFGNTVFLLILLGSITFVISYELLKNILVKVSNTNLNILEKKTLTYF